jgi:hypothetical protein
MALINCSECAKEVSDKAATCPNCGVSINRQEKQRKKISQKTKTIFIILSVVVVLGGAGAFAGYKIHTSNLEKARVIAEEGRIAEEERIIAEENQEIANSFNGFVADLQNKDTLSQVEVLELDRRFDELTEAQKELVDVDAISKAKELRPIELAVIGAIDVVKDAVWDSSSVILMEAKVKEDVGLWRYSVLIRYSATNAFGGRTENLVVLNLDEKYKDVIYPLSKLTGRQREHLENGGRYIYYTGLESLEIVICEDRITANIK